MIFHLMKEMLIHWHLFILPFLLVELILLEPCYQVINCRFFLKESIHKTKLYHILFWAIIILVRIYVLLIDLNFIYILTFSSGGACASSRTGPPHKTPLHLAAASGNVCIMEMLIKRGAGWRERDDWGWNVLHEVSAAGHAQGNLTPYL